MAEPIVHDHGQWTVHHWGLAADEHDYEIDIEALGERDEDDELIWPRMVARQTWLDWRSFEAAFRQAVELHGDAILHPFAPAEMELALSEAAADHRRRQAYWQVFSEIVDDVLGAGEHHARRPMALEDMDQDDDDTLRRLAGIGAP